MGTGGVIAFIVLVVLLGIPTVLLFVDNTAALNKEKQLRAAVKQLEQDAAAMPADASPEDVAALQARVTAVGREMDEWLRSPFVIPKPPAR